MQTHPNETNVHDKAEPFSVYVFSEHRRISRPSSVQFLHHLYRWSVYVFAPFFLFLIPVAGAVYVIVHPIKIPFDTANAVNITAIIFFGIVIPGVLLTVWYRSLPWWFLNGTERCWRDIKILAEENEHLVPDDFWQPFFDDEFGAKDDAFADELRINAETDINGFIVSDINISYKENIFAWKTSMDQFGFYLESGYWKLEQYGLRFYGERMNVFIPYRAMREVKRGFLWCNIILKFDTKFSVTRITLGTTTVRYWTEVCISIGHLLTMCGDRMLRDELYQRIAAKVTAARIVDAVVAAAADITE